MPAATATFARAASVLLPRGLARVNAPSGTLISFATRPGSTASDGDGSHGLYRTPAAANGPKPNVPIEASAERRGDRCRKAASGAAGSRGLEGSLDGDFYGQIGGPQLPLRVSLAQQLHSRLSAKQPQRSNCRSGTASKNSGKSGRRSRLSRQIPAGEQSSPRLAACRAMSCAARLPPLLCPRRRPPAPVSWWRRRKEPGAVVLVAGLPGNGGAGCRPARS